ncbi:hypothetical protein Dsin_017011 [Dipteronia sinensis]|uniref:Uncharacterized protein n=1 Tax=Dipteronia sinensis TaxID=43782 RepID=A0AAE0AFL7_9ROSI|nr:hypothetical protein Dsin_017011 [Dipteronia sinensis]
MSNFIYNHGWVLEILRKFDKRDIVQPATMRFATTYLGLEKLSGVKCCICFENHKPLADVLRFVDSEKEPAMGFIYGAMDAAKETKSAYKEILKIIDDKWDFQLHRDLHAAAYYLNPQFKWESNFSTHLVFKSNLTNVWRDSDLIHPIPQSLVYIMYNKKLKLRYLKNRSSKRDEDSLINQDIPSDDELIANPNDEESTEDGDEELNLDVDEMANKIRGSLQLIDEGEDDFGD